MAEATDPSEFEFLEMMNISATDTIDLTDVRFVEGIDFTFTGSAITSLAPGQRVLIVCDLPAFEARYGAVHSHRIAGEFRPTRLDNAGERIHLVDALGLTIADFTYNDKNPWPTEAGFAGYSMVLKSSAMPNPDYTSPASWRSSGLLDGNPDGSDSTPLVGSPSADADLDDLDALTEHALGTSDADPTAGDGAFWASVQTIEVQDVLSDYLTLTWQRNITADDVEITPELSTDLLTWVSGEPHLIFVSETNQGDGTSLVTYRTADPFDPQTSPRAFLRLNVTLLP